MQSVFNIVIFLYAGKELVVMQMWAMYWYSDDEVYKFEKSRK